MSKQHISAHSVDVHVGKKLRERRIVSGMSQQTLGTHLGISFQQVQKYERGINRISIGMLYQAAVLLKAPMSYFFEELADTDLINEKEEEIEAQATVSQEAEMATKPEMATKREMLELTRLYSNVESPAIRASIRHLLKEIITQKR